MSIMNKHIFYAEDDVRNRAIVQTALSFAGATVTMGYDRDVQGIMRMLQKSYSIDLILLDLMYPYDMSGYDIFKAIREKPEYDSIPVIILSAADPGSEIPKAKALGLDGFIAKPLDSRAFPNQIEACLKGEKIWSEGILSYL